MSPPVSVSAFLQSIIPAPVRSRSSLTCLAVIVGVLTSRPSPASRSRSARRRRTRRRATVPAAPAAAPATAPSGPGARSATASAAASGGPGGAGGDVLRGDRGGAGGALRRSASRRRPPAAASVRRRGSGAPRRRPGASAARRLAAAGLGARASAAAGASAASVPAAGARGAGVAAAGASAAVSRPALARRRRLCGRRSAATGSRPCGSRRPGLAPPRPRRPSRRPRPARRRARRPPPPRLARLRRASASAAAAAALGPGSAPARGGSWRACRARCGRAGPAARRPAAARLAGRRARALRPRPPPGARGRRRSGSGAASRRARADVAARRACAGSSAACAAAPASAARRPSARRPAAGPATASATACSASSRGSALAALGERRAGGPLGRLAARLLLGLAAARAPRPRGAPAPRPRWRARSSSARKRWRPCGDDVADRARDDVAGADRVVVARDDVVDAVGVAVGVDQPDDRDAQALGLAHGDRLGLEVDDEQRVGHALHVLDAAEVRPQLLEVGLGGQALARRQQRELALGLVALEVVQALDAREIVWKFVSRPPSQRWLTYGMPGGLGDLLDAVARLLLGADEEHGAAAAGEAVGEALGRSQQRLGLQQVDDVDAAALAVDEAAHLRVPAARLVAEVHAGLQQLPDADFEPRGRLPLVVVRWPGRRCARTRRMVRRAGPRASVAARGRGVDVASVEKTVQCIPGLVRTEKFTVGPQSLPVRWSDRGPVLPSPTSGGPARLPLRRVAERGGEVAGSGDVDVDRLRRVTGCANASRAACRNWRSRPSAAGVPYSGSPATGWPIACRWARIWCVRPVSRRTRSSVVARQRALDRRSA